MRLKGGHGLPPPLTSVVPGPRIRIEILSVSQRAQIGEPPPPKVLPIVLSKVFSESEVLSRVLPREHLLVVHHRENPSRALLGALRRAPRFLRALLKALSEALLGGVSLIWALSAGRENLKIRKEVREQFLSN